MGFQEFSAVNPLKLSTALFCEHALESRGRWTIVGMFRGLRFNTFPAELEEMEVLLIITDAVGIAPQLVCVELVDSEALLAGGGDEHLWADEARLHAKELPGVYEAAFQVPPLPLQHPGRYDLHVQVDGELIDLVSLHVEKGPAA